jgi:hypothetical protein
MLDAKMKNTDEYKKTFSIIKKEINKWDPYELINCGAPDNEFDDEIAKIVVNLKNISSENSLKAIISNIFAENFEADCFTPEECEEVAKRIKESLIQNKASNTRVNTD